MCGLCLPHIWHYLSGIEFLKAIEILMGVMTISFALPFDLYKVLRNSAIGFFYKDFNLKDTKLQVQLPRPSRKQSTIYISSNPNLVFLTCSLLSANTDLLLRPFSLRKELNTSVLYFLLKSLFSAMLGILSTPLFCWLK